MLDGDWKLVTLPNGGLYNLSTDLKEENNLSKKYPERVTAMKTAIEKWKQDVAHGATQHPAWTGEKI